jgi:hypothetical protein
MRLEASLQPMASRQHSTTTGGQVATRPVIPLLPSSKSAKKLPAAAVPATSPLALECMDAGPHADFEQNVPELGCMALGRVPM